MTLQIGSTVKINFPGYFLHGKTLPVKDKQNHLFINGVDMGAGVTVEVDGYRYWLRHDQVRKIGGEV